MASNFYHYVLPDYSDLDNKTGHNPGYVFGVRENDGGVGLYIHPADVAGDTDEEYATFLNVDEAQQLVSALQEAIARAAHKKAAHKHRVKEPQ